MYVFQAKNCLVKSLKGYMKHFYVNLTTQYKYYILNVLKK